MSHLIRTWEVPADRHVGDTVKDFLCLLGGPCWIHLAGKDRSRTRSITTLLHGNEPSGARALQRFLKDGDRPATDVLALVAAVKTALEPPGFAYRMLPGARDLNRCFAGPYSELEGMLAREILDGLQAARPEALVDVHNTSGSGPAYGVGTRLSPACLAITSLFASQYVLTDIRLGSLMEATADAFPTVTIECGGARSAAADEVAFNGLQRFLCGESVLSATAASRDVVVLKHPLRVCLGPGASIAYSQAPVAGRTLTLRDDIDRFNSTVLPPHEIIGWTNELGALNAAGSPGLTHVEELFDVRSGRLRAKRALRLFMATTEARIAEDDCVFYVVPV